MNSGARRLGGERLEDGGRNEGADIAAHEAICRTNVAVMGREVAPAGTKTV